MARIIIFKGRDFQFELDENHLFFASPALKRIFSNPNFRESQSRTMDFEAEDREVVRAVRDFIMGKEYAVILDEEQQKVSDEFFYAEDRPGKRLKTDPTGYKTVVHHITELSPRQRECIFMARIYVFANEYGIEHLMHDVEKKFLAALDKHSRKPYFAKVLKEILEIIPDSTEALLKAKLIMSLARDYNEGKLPEAVVRVVLLENQTTWKITQYYFQLLQCKSKELEEAAKQLDFERAEAEIERTTDDLSVDLEYGQETIDDLKLVETEQAEELAVAKKLRLISNAFIQCTKCFPRYVLDKIKVTKTGFLRIAAGCDDLIKFQCECQSSDDEDYEDDSDEDDSDEDDSDEDDSDEDDSDGDDSDGDDSDGYDSDGDGSDGHEADGGNDK